MVRRRNIETGFTDRTEAAINREIIRREMENLPKDFYAFVKAAWDKVDQNPFRDGFHIQAICSHLQACGERRLKQLCINIPPRCGKSTLCAALFPAWILCRSPKETLLFASYSAKLANDDSVRCRRLIESQWYQERFPHVQIEDDSNLKTAYLTTAGGGRQTTSVGGTTTGLGGAFLVLDDPINVQDADSETVRETANQWFRESWQNRVKGDPDQAVRIVIMQRVHEDDTSAICKNAGWCMLELPMEYEGEAEPNAFGWKDPRTTFGQLMWPDQWSQKTIDGLKEIMRGHAYAGQYQQRPAPRGGGVFKAAWLRFWYDPSVMTEPPPVRTKNDDGSTTEAEQIEWTPPGSGFVGSFDCTFKGGKKADYVVGQTWYRKGGNYFLVDQIRAQMDFPKTCEAVRAMHSQYRPLPTLVEEKANGAAVLSALRNEIDGLLGINPEGGKEARANAVAPLFHSGNVWLPHPSMYPWVDQAIQEITFFPKAKNDDVVDALSQALVYMRERKVDLVDAGAAFGGNSVCLVELVTDGSYFSN